ncbi:sigma-70 family RNA polymerase sigma factor [Thauera sp. Sel9]|uniref:sigma-70 family RNA polymerase sigma factor n=1 Tax=Thauera sp. Sel9 TaxID=2974299 RepID=UPI0021E17757|nr:sigma-70 family RNA polymerase sigma factor [Thauera sp. Sel9]MCV2216302.1 sigma-70 family RNA polymerase sigma factor [Thauera sp. Sel9]
MGMTEAGAPAQDVATLYHDNHRWLSAWLRARMGNKADADDLAQDTFIRVLCAHANVQMALREPRAYLATVAGRLMANFYRRQSIERAYLEVLATLPQDEIPSLETQALMKEALLEIDQMLDGLGIKVKQAFLLAQFEEMPYAQIAERLGVSLRTVKNYVARAMVHCCEMMP